MSRSAICVEVICEAICGDAIWVELVIDYAFGKDHNETFGDQNIVDIQRDPQNPVFADRASFFENSF